jgi:hypothetical protein
MPRSSRLLAVGAALVLGLTGTALAADEPAATDTTRLFLANDGADCGNADAPFLTVATRTTDINCGYVGGGLPFGEVFHQSGQLESGRTFGTRGTDGGALPLVTDAARDAVGVVTVRSGNQQGVGLPGTGQVVAEIGMRVKVGRTYVDLGSQTLEGMATGDQKDLVLPFTFDLPAKLQGAQVSAVEFDLDVRGLHVWHGFMSLNGKTFVDLPTVAPVEPTTSG